MKKRDAQPMLVRLFLMSAFMVSTLLANANKSLFHPFYVSVTEINYDSKGKSVEISCKMFTEDLEDVLKLNTKMNVDLSSQKQLEKNNQLVQAYITKHLSVAVNSKAVGFKFIGFEREKESTYCYFEIENVPVFYSVEINNTLLHDFKKEQINIMHVVANGKRESTKLNYPKSQARFTFKLANKESLN